MPAEPAGAAPVELLRCGACGTAVTGGPPPGADRHDSGAYASARPRLAGVAGPILRAFDRRRLALLRAPAGGRLLDVGAGRGRFVAGARAAGYRAEGIEPSARGVEAARTVYGIELERTTLDAAERPLASLDGITAWHVLEHLDDPAAALRRMEAWLVAGGHLLIGVPNLASAQAAVGGGRWYHLDVPRHRVHFTPTGLEALLRRTGFAPVAISHVLVEHNPFGMWQSLVSRLTRRPSYVYNLLKRNAPAASADLAISLACLPLVPVAAVAELLAGLAGRGGTIAVLARRVAVEEGTLG